MNSSPIIVHVGLEKTATSTLQKQVFPMHEELYYLGGTQYRDGAFRNAITAIVNEDRLHYDSSYHQEQCRNALSEARSQDKPILLSTESLTTIAVDRLTKAERIVELFGNTKILLCLRRPEDLIVSYFSESIKRLNPTTHRIPSFDDWLQQQWSTQRATRQLRVLDYSRLIKGYRNLVGKDNVCVLLFEELCNDPEEYARQLSEFIGINSRRTLELLQDKKENKRVNQLDYINIRLSNILGSREAIGKIRQFIPKPIREIIKKSLSGTKRFSMSDEWREKIRAYCREENKDLCELVGSGPERYDYF